MKLACREYITGKDIRDEQAATSLGEALLERLSTSLKEGRMTGYRVVTVRNHDDILDHDLDEVAILEDGGGEFPLVQVNVTFAVGKHDPSVFAFLEHEYGLKLLDEYVSPE